MHWGSSFFLLFLSLCFIFCMLPLRLEFNLQHQRAWSGRLVLHLLWLRYDRQFPAKAEQVPDIKKETAEQPAQEHVIITEKNISDIVGHKLGKAESHNKKVDSKTENVSRETFSRRIQKNLQEKKEQVFENRSFYADWKQILAFIIQSAGIILSKLRLDHLSLRCQIGFSQPDRTAYSYALFWAVLSVLPPKWMEQVEADYLPDFQQQRQDIAIEGIISTSIGQLISMTIWLLWLASRAKLEQDRKEQIAYEN